MLNVERKKNFLKIHLAKLLSKHEEIKTYLNKKLKEFVTTRSTLQEMLKRVKDLCQYEKETRNSLQQNEEIRILE